MGESEKRVRTKSKKFFQRNGILYTILIPYAAYTIIVLIIYFILIEVLVFHHTKSVIENSTNRTLEQIYHTSDILLEYNFSYYFDVYYAAQTRRYLNASNMDPNQYTEVVDYLLDCAGRDIITHSLYLYNEQLGIVFTSNGGAFPIEDFYDREMIDFFVMGDGAGRFIPRSLEEKPGSSWKTSNVISYCFQDESLSPGKHMALIVNIGQEKYQGLIGKNLEDTSVTAEVINDDGYLVSGAQGGIGQRISDSYSQHILQSGKEKGTFNYNDPNGEFYVSWRNSNYFGWIYVGRANYGELLSGFYRYNFIIIASAVLFVLLGLFFSFIFTRRIYVPLRKLISRVDVEGMQDSDCLDEYELLNAALKELEVNASQMKGIEYRYHLSKRNEIIRKLLHGDSYWEKNEKELEKAGLIYKGAVYCVASFSFNHLDSLKNIYSQSDMELFCFSIINMLEEYLGNRGYTVYGVEDDNYSVHIIMQLEEEYEKSAEYALNTFPNENITAIQQLLYEAKKELERVLKPITLFVSVGRSVDGADELHRSWLDTKYADIYRFVRGTEQITLFTPHMENYESGIPYPIEIEKQLLSNLKASKENEVLLNLDEFFAAIEKMAPDEMRWAINQIMTSIFRISMMNQYKMKDNSPLDWKSWTHKINATDTADEMREMLIQLLMNLSVESGDSHSAKQKTAAAIKDFVDGNFSDSTLSVTGIAVCAGVSVNYARQIFKDRYGISISDYILEKRIEKAKELLLTTDYTSKKIAEMAGYTDHRYFYVVFKKKVGETAENFRRKKGLSSEDSQEIK